jgi:FkbM family methyltransferase
MSTIKSMILDTPLERPARAAKRAVSWLRGERLEDWQIRTMRDNRRMQKILQSQLQENSNCIDVGAHAGEWLEQFVKLSPHGKHFAFEPLPHLAKALQEKFPNVSVQQCALSDVEGTCTFYHCPQLEGWSGLKQQPYPIKAAVNEIQVQTRLLDRILPVDLPITYIKIDVEGAELQVLRGAVETLRRFKPHVVFEHARVHAHEYGTTPQMIFDLLNDQCGLAVCTLDGTKLTRSSLAEMCRRSHDSNYDKNAETNFLARAPR